MPGTIFSRQTMKNRDWKEARSHVQGNHTVRPGHVREQARRHGAREGRADRQRDARRRGGRDRQRREILCFCKLASTVWALFFGSIGGWFPAETAPSEPAAPFFLGYLVMRACSLR